MKPDDFTVLKFTMSVLTGETATPQNSKYEREEEKKIQHTQSIYIYIYFPTNAGDAE